MKVPCMFDVSVLISLSSVLVLKTYLIRGWSLHGVLKSCASVMVYTATKAYLQGVSTSHCWHVVC